MCTCRFHFMGISLVCPKCCQVGMSSCCPCYAGHQSTPCCGQVAARAQFSLFIKWVLVNPYSPAENTAILDFFLIEGMTRTHRLTVWWIWISASFLIKLKKGYEMLLSNVRLACGAGGLLLFILFFFPDSFLLLCFFSFFFFSISLHLQRSTVSCCFSPRDFFCLSFR